MSRVLDVSRANAGLSRIVDTKQYPKVKRPYVERRPRGRVFRLGVLHSKEFSEEALLRNRRGFINAQVNTVAHSPSMYHWLFHRCGVPFAETRELVRQGRLRADGTVIKKESDLESQLQWSTFQNLDLQIYSTLPALGRSSTAGSSDRMAEEDAAKDSQLPEGRWVPALKRALHRSYYFQLLHSGISLSSEEANPKSFVHRVTPLLGPQAAECAALGLNVLRPVGLVDGIRGLGIVSNDVAMIRYWNNDCLGNYGEYDVRFAAGVPDSIIAQAEGEVRQALSHVRQQIPPCVTIPCSVKRVTMSRHESGEGVPALFPDQALHPTQRLAVQTPLLPFRTFTKLRRAGAFFTLVRSGPFVMPRSFYQRDGKHIIALSPAELALLFTFERKLKTNRVLMSLTEFDEGGDAGL